MHGAWQDHELFEAWHPWSKASSTISPTCNQGEHHGRAQVTKGYPEEEARRSSTILHEVPWLHGAWQGHELFEALHPWSKASSTISPTCNQGQHHGEASSHTAAEGASELMWCKVAYALRSSSQNVSHTYVYLQASLRNLRTSA